MCNDRQALLTMTARINDILQVEDQPPPRTPTKEAALVKAVDDVNSNPVAVMSMLDRYSDMLVTMVQDKMTSGR